MTPGWSRSTPSSRSTRCPPAPPKNKKQASFKKEDKPKGPIPTKFTGRMYDLDDNEDESVDVTPDFMKPDTDTDTDEGER